MTPREIHIDIETYSSVDLKKCGTHKYAASPDFEIMLITIGYKDADHNRVYEQYAPGNGDPIPESRVAWIKDKKIVKYAFNAMFERVCLSAALGVTLDPASWRCVMVMSGFAGLPLSLDRVSKVLQLENVKLAGTHLINYFAKPCKPTKANGGRRRNLPRHNVEKWREYSEYNRVDVATEWDIKDYLEKSGLRVPGCEWLYYAVDQRINDRGVYVDTVMARNAVKMAADIKGHMISEIERITGVSNGRSVSQLVAWLNDNGCDCDNLRAETLKKLLTDLPPGDARDVIALREQASRTSTDKYAAAVQCAQDDNRARGLFAFNGAYRTGRYAGRRVQLQNLSRIHFSKNDKDLDRARRIVRRGDTDTLEALYSAPIEILSQLIRTVFTAPPGRVLNVADYSSIEARVLAWLADEYWKLEVFRTHGKIYEATASRMFNIPIEEITKDSQFRQQGKVAELAFGYEGSVGAVEKMGFLADGTLSLLEVQRMVKMWRRQNPNIVKMWRSVEEAAINAVRCPGERFRVNKCTFEANNTWLFIRLPSGRELAYYKPFIKANRWGDTSLWYFGEDDRRQWNAINTYGGKLTENITQAVARDLLCEAQYRIECSGHRIVLHVHDEIVCEVDKDVAPAALTDLCGSITTEVNWATGLPLRADGFTTEYYKK